jgi:hypothetical protein
LQQSVAFLLHIHTSAPKMANVQDPYHLAFVRALLELVDYATGDDVGILVAASTASLSGPSPNRSFVLLSIICHSFGSFDEQ